jgi:hypothetical protein
MFPRYRILRTHNSAERSDTHFSDLKRLLEQSGRAKNREMRLTSRHLDSTVNFRPMEWNV